MNQILDYNPDKSSTKKTSKSDNVVRVFAILLAVFAVCLLAIGGYSLTKNKSIPEEEVAVKKSEPSIQVLELENALEINIVHDKELSMVVYSWDQGKETMIDVNGSEVHEQISLLAGEHSLTVKATDVDGEDAIYTGKYKSDVGEDKEKPVIDTRVEGNKVIVTVTDETEISYLTYKWNNDEETEVKATRAEQKELTTEIEILMGKNDLTIVAVDSNNNYESKTISYTGVTKPVIKIVVSENKDRVDVNITHEKGLKEVVGQINGQNFQATIADESQDISFPIPLDTSIEKNVIKITAISLSNTKTEEEFEVVNETAQNDNIVITLGLSEEDSSKVNVRIESPDGIKELYLTINDVELNCNLGDSQPEERTDVNFDIEVSDLVQGNNVLTFKVVKPNGIEKVETKELQLGN